MGQAVGAGIELGVGERVLLLNEGYCRGALLYLRLEQLMYDCGSGNGTAVSFQM
jgi:hypothetical protein